MHVTNTHRYARPLYEGIYLDRVKNVERCHIFYHGTNWEIGYNLFLEQGTAALGIGKIIWRVQSTMANGP